jgi:uncharacterized protein (TIGR03032 family)
VKLSSEFIRVPLRFDVERLQEEVLAVPEESWRPHPQGNPGNWALPLIAAGGDPTDDSTVGPMAATPHLEGLEYLRQVLESFQTVFGRSRLMRLDGNTDATLHVDTNYYWAERVRIHVPIVTSPAIEFICGGSSMHMPAGEAWIFDAWKRHNVINPTGDRRIHLVADTVGSGRFWDLVDRQDAEATFVPHRPGERATLEIEQRNFSPVMGPWELERLASDLVLDGIAADAPPAEAERIRVVTRSFLADWRAVWARFGPTPEGVDTYRRLLAAYEAALAPLAGQVRLTNLTDAVNAARQLLVQPALTPRLFDQPSAPAPAAPSTPSVSAAAPAPRRTGDAASRIERPVFIVAPPRSGTSLLFETLAQSPSVWTIGGESHRLIEGVPTLSPADRGWDSNRLSATDATPEVVERLEAAFLAELRDRDGNRPGDATGLCLLEKTPKNSLRVPFLAKAFPDARFVYLYREPHESLASMMAAWESGRFVTYPQLPGWDGPPWSLVLTPEWRALNGADLAEVVAEQWRMTSEILLHDLAKVPEDRWAVTGYHNLVADPQGEITRLCDFLDLEWDRELTPGLPLSRHTLTPPRPDKWKEHAAALDPVLERTEAVARRGREWLARPITLTPQVDDEAGETDSPYRSISAGNLGEILGALGSTLLLSTYQTGRLVAVRSTGSGVNTHFRTLESPMGISYDAGRLAVGTRAQVCEYQNLPALVERIDPPGRHDAVFVPRRVSYTGDVRIHDVAHVGDELWFVATRFSCLATLDDEHSFVPRWRPPFITELAAEDRCHLNGMAVVGDEVRYVTALGETDTPGGWRDDKAAGGVIIDVPSGETLVRGLSMPHSPRVHRDRLWFLESGKGTLATVDLGTGAVETVATLPGFTRGLAFAGNLAFVGLSEVREATTFGGLPLTARLEDRQCGVWVVDIDTGRTVSFLRFEDLVEEIFDVTLLPGMLFPEIAEHGSDAVNSAFVVPHESLA